MTDLVTRTACGLYAFADADPTAWPNFTWTTQVADLPGDQEDFDALTLIARELGAATGTDTTTDQFTTPTDVAFACLHAGDPTRVDHPGLAYADPAVDVDEVDADAYQPQQPWTVCGVLQDTWRTVRLHTTAGTPLVGYLRAWEHARDQFGGYLLLAAVHRGHLPSLECFGYADPWARDDATMRLTAARWTPAEH